MYKEFRVAQKYIFHPEVIKQEFFVHITVSNPRNGRQFLCIEKPFILLRWNEEVFENKQR